MPYDEPATTGAGALAFARHAMPRMRHAPPAYVFALDVAHANFAPPQPPAWSQLCTLRSGVATLRSARACWTLTPEVGVWVPAGRPYVLEAHGACEIRAIYTHARPALGDAVTAVAVVPLLRELLERTTVAGYLDPAHDRDAHLLHVIDDELTNLVPALGEHSLALPRDPRLADLLEGTLSSPDATPSIAALARASHVSLRTFERHFLAETGLTPRAWLRVARLRAAVVALEAGATVTEAGFACGYASTSAFIAAFRARFARSPGTYRQRAIRNAAARESAGGSLRI